MFKKDKICLNCGTIGKPKFHTKGSIFLEVILWIMFIVPGVIYSLWRHGSRQWVCRECKSPGIVSLKSPKGRQLLAESQN